ncbi:GNAT family N-acetyltransferase [Flavobacteriaceae bacterium]|nr:GNAT family N-acetyltransferase [Flavobacteriaceae bacterium]
MRHQKDNIILGDFKEENLLKTFNWVNNKDFQKKFLFERDISWNDHIDWYNKYSKDTTQKVFTINVDNIHIGNIGLKHIDNLKKSAESWIYIGDETFAGKGYAKRAYQLIMIKSVHMGINKLIANIGFFNKGSIFLHEKTGFKKMDSITDVLFDKKIVKFVYEINLLGDNNLSSKKK